MTIKGVIFDLGSTLIEFRGDWSDIFRGMSVDLIAYLRAHGYVMDFEKFDRRYQEVVDQFYTRGQQDWIEYTAEYTLRYTLAEFGYPEVPDEILKGGLAAAYAQGELLWQPFIDVYRTLDALKARGYKIGLISNARDAANVERLIDQRAAAAVAGPDRDLGQRRGAQAQSAYLQDRAGLLAVAAGSSGDGGRHAGRGYSRRAQRGAARRVGDDADRARSERGARPHHRAGCDDCESVGTAGAAGKLVGSDKETSRHGNSLRAVYRRFTPFLHVCAYTAHSLICH